MPPYELTWRQLTAEEMTHVYLNEMRRDFPAGELKPLSTILNGEAAGFGHTWGVFHGEKLAAYLVMVCPPGSAVSQLDYFAVVPDYRAAGLGAQLLEQLRVQEKGVRAIMIESEYPEKAEDEAMARRRLGFYARSGAVDTGWVEKLFDSWFRILVLDCGEAAMEAGEAIHALGGCYRATMGKDQWKRFIRFYAPNGVDATED